MPRILFLCCILLLPFAGKTQTDFCGIHPSITVKVKLLTSMESVSFAQSLQSCEKIMQQGCFQFEERPSGVFEIIDGPAPYFKKSKVLILFPYGWFVGKTGSEYELRVRILPTGPLLQAMPLLEVVY